MVDGCIVSVNHGQDEPQFVRVANNFRRTGALDTFPRVEIPDGSLILIGEWPDGGEFVMRGCGYWNVDSQSVK